LHNIKEGVPYKELDQLLYDIKHGFSSAMDDDLNISAALASIFKIVKKINILALSGEIDPDGASKILNAFRNIDSALKIFDFANELSDNELSDPEIERLIKERDKARREKNWDLADRIRDQLISRGITIKDIKT
ncbi:MAG: DALR domain-containing protein, partial [Thermodesulfobacteriota bacterium]|nr:DALR domain-containing protein [Thermodesulfobacteriota bacterium]